MLTSPLLQKLTQNIIYTSGLKSPLGTYQTTIHSRSSARFSSEDHIKKSKTRKFAPSRMFELLPTLVVKPTASVLKLIPHMPRSCSTTIMQHRYHVMPCPTSAIWFCIVGAFDKGLNRLSLQRWCIEKLLDITKECLALSIHGQCLHRILLE